MSGSRHSCETCPFDAIVAVGSQGALDSFGAMVRLLPPAFPAAVVFDLHRANGSDATERMLGRRCELPVCAAADGLELERGQVYVAPHDRQLVIDEDLRLELLDSSAGVGHRFADGLLASAALALGPRLIAVVLSGRLYGGALGVREVKRRGGRVMVEDPMTAGAPSMPSAALATGCVDFVLSPERLGDALLAFCAAVGAAELFRVRMNAATTG